MWDSGGGGVVVDGISGPGVIAQVVIVFGGVHVGLARSPQGRVRADGT